MSYNIRPVETSDAEFILGLRTNPKLNRFLSSTSGSREDQVKWIEQYKVKEKKGEEFYYLVEEDGVKRGLFRLYNINSVSFTVGSWLFTSCENKNLPILSYLLMCDIGFYDVNLPVLLFDVRKKNRKVLQFTSLKNPLFYTEDKLNKFFLVLKENWEKSKKNVLDFYLLMRKL